MMTDPGELVTALRRTLGTHWAFDSQGDHLCIRHQARGASYRPRRRPVSWDEMLTILAATFAEHGIAQAPPLPLRWNRETDFTISAIQALDPHLKQRRARSSTMRRRTPPGHPATLYIVHSVARWTGQAGDPAQARDRYAALLSERERILGPEHPDTRVARRNLAYWTNQAGSEEG
jgi:hypothetical protein